MEFDHLYSTTLNPDMQSPFDWAIEASLTDLSPVSETDSLVPFLPDSFDLFNELSSLSSSDQSCYNNPSSTLVPNQFYLPPPSTQHHFDDFNFDCFMWDETCFEDIITDAVPLNIIPTLGDLGGVETCMEKGTNGRVRLSSIGFDEIKRYFYMPITRAAKEMNVGLTLLKKRCRELGIARWPHRKMKSLKSLIHNVQELGKGGGEESVRKELETLEEHRRLMEEKPEMELTERTKKLRQACFKANYKKRRAMEPPSFDHPFSL